MKLVNKWLNYLDEDYEINQGKFKKLKTQLENVFREELDFNNKAIGKSYIEAQDDLLKFVRKMTYFLDTSAKTIKDLEKD